MDLLKWEAKLMDWYVSKGTSSKIKLFHPRKILYLKLWQDCFETIMCQIIIGQVKLIFNLLLHVQLPWLHIKYLLSCFSFLSLIRFFQVDTHEHLVFLKSLHLVEVLVIESTSKLVVIHVEVTHHLFLLPFNLTHWRCLLLLHVALWIDYWIKFKRGHNGPDKLIGSDLCPDLFVVWSVKRHSSHLGCALFSLRISTYPTHATCKTLFSGSICLLTRDWKHILYNFEGARLVEDYVLLSCAVCKEQPHLVSLDVIWIFGQWYYAVFTLS